MTSVMTDVMKSQHFSLNISKTVGQLEVADSVLLGAYRKVAKWSRMVTSRDHDVIVVKSQRQILLLRQFLSELNDLLT